MLIRQGDVGDCMYVILEGEAEILFAREGREVPVRRASAGEIIGEMALFDREVRSATVRAHGEMRALTVDKRTFLKRVHEDPSLAFRVGQNMSMRIRELTTEIVRLKQK